MKYIIVFLTFLIISIIAGLIFYYSKPDFLLQIQDNDTSNQKYNWGLLILVSMLCGLVICILPLLLYFPKNKALQMQKLSLVETDKQINNTPKRLTQSSIY
jgi:hypothetical protein